MNKNLVHIVVEAKSSFGVKDKITGNWFNPRKDLAKDILPKLIIGAEYDVDMEETKDKDKKTYSNIVSVAPVTGAPVIVAPVFAKTPTAKPLAENKVAISAPAKTQYVGRDFDKEARGKTMCALLEAGLQSPRIAMFSTNKEIFEFLDAVVEYGIKKVFKD